MIVSITGQAKYAIASSLVLSLATTGCALQHRPKLQYSGELTSATCPKTHGTLVIQRDAVVFAPDDGTWTLEGKATGSTVNASKSSPGVDHKLFATVLEATFTETKATGTYSTPTCTYSVDLTRF